MKKALIVSYHFPPSSSTGAIRPMKFVKYLRDFGWEPIVLTCKDAFDFGSDKDAQLLNEVPKDIRIISTSSFEPLNWFWQRKRRATNDHVLLSETAKPANAAGVKSSGRLKGFILDLMRIPDRCNGWIPFAVLRGVRAIRNYNIDIIFATTPPATSILAAYLISKWTKKPLVVDYRDPWLSAGWARRNFRLFENINKGIENIIHSHAACIISASKRRSEEFKHVYPDIAFKYKTITNGYDSEHISFSKNNTFDKLTFIHAGSLYNYNSVDSFLQAINSIAENDVDIRNHTKVIFVGSKPNTPLFDSLAKSGIVEYKGRIPRQECFDLTAKAHVLLAFLEKNEFSRGWLLLKVFDYMMFKKPILGIMPDGEMQDLIYKTQTGSTVDPDNIEGIKRAIRDTYMQFKKNELTVNPDPDLISRLHRKELTKDLAGIFDNVLKH